jgi:hypothetical protein
MMYRRLNAAIVHVVRCVCAATTLLAVSGSPNAVAQTAVPAEFHGTWAPAGSACDSAVRVLVAAQVLTLFNGKDSAAIGGIEMAGPGYFPPGYRGLEAVLITEFNGHQPATMTFNAGEKKGLAQVVFSTVTTGKGNAQLNAYNARIARLDLAKRFPLNNLALRKCP